MMRIWLGVGILVLFLILGLATSTIMENAHLPTCEMLEQAVEKTAKGDFDGAVNLGMAAKRRWDRHWNGTASVADHSPMDDVDALFAEMEIYAQTEEQPHFAACCNELVRRLTAMAQAHTFSWWNIF